MWLWVRVTWMRVRRECGTCTQFPTCLGSVDQFVLCYRSKCHDRYTFAFAGKCPHRTLTFVRVCVHRMLGVFFHHVLSESGCSAMRVKRSYYRVTHSQRPSVKARAYPHGPMLNTVNPSLSSDHDIIAEALEEPSSASEDGRNVNAGAVEETYELVGYATSAVPTTAATISAHPRRGAINPLAVRRRLQRCARCDCLHSFSRFCKKRAFACVNVCMPLDRNRCASQADPAALMPTAPLEQPLGHVEAGLEQHLRVFLRCMIPLCLDAAAVRCAGGATTTDIVLGDVHHAFTLLTAREPNQTPVILAPM